MRIGILSRNEMSWCSQQIKEALKKKSVQPLFFKFTDLIVEIENEENFLFNTFNVKSDIPGILVRPIGRGSLEDVIFRIDLLHRLSSHGTLIVNPPIAIETAADKYRTLSLLAKAGIPVPRSVITQNISKALEGFDRLKGEVVLKPIFGSRGIGTALISDRDIAERAFRTILFQKQVIYIQEFLKDILRDIRAFVIDGRVISAMERISDKWKKNISRGGRPSHIILSSEVNEMAISAAEEIGCKIAGVDIIERKNGPVVIEANSQPGWRGLQSVTEVNIADNIVDFIIQEVKK